jgi:hypothetical protein
MSRDVVVMVRAGREYDELRYALRSLTNLPHGRVWVYGAEPKWLVNAVHVPVRQGAVGHANTARIMAAIAGNRALSDEFYWWHDDMYVTAPVDAVPRLWRCTWPEWEAGAKLRRDPHGPAKTAATAEALRAFGREPALCYELHVPMVVERDTLRQMVAEVTAWRPEILAQAQKRSLYGNWADVGGERAQDVKFYRTTPVEALGTFASSSDLALTSPIGQRVRDLFPDPGPYEARTGGLITRSQGEQLMAGHLAGRWT